MSLPTPTFADLKKLFDDAEAALKHAEHGPVKLVFPAINELRYAGRHIVEALAAGTDDAKRDRELHKAQKHCKRALYDVFEAEFMFASDWYDLFRSAHTDVQLSAIIPDYVQIQFELKNALKGFREISPADREKKELFAERVRELRDIVLPLIDRLDSSSDEIAKYRSVENEKRLQTSKNSRQARLILFLTVLSTGVAIAAYAWPRAAVAPPESTAPAPAATTDK